jgi:CSLREA domain-containing protein
MNFFYILSPQRLFWRRSRLLVALAMVSAMLSVASPAYAASITVTTTTDEFGTGAACSLREAIQAANTNAAFGGCSAGSGADTISVPAGTYTLTLTGIEDANLTGDLDVTSSITIAGAGQGSTIIDGNNADRVFDVFPSSAITFDLSDVTVRNGHTPSTGFNVGGAVYLHNNVTATISNSTFSGNVATTSGGAIESRGGLTVTNSTFSNNSSGALGGGINASSTSATLSVTGSTFTGNQAEAGGALNIATNAGSSSSISTSLFQNNQTVLVAGGADENGGAIRIDTDGDVSITKSTFTGNTALVNGGAIYFNDNATQTSAPTLTASYNRIVGNTAASGGGLFRASGTATAEKNWWGCNGGPSAGPCNLVAGTVDFTPWIVLSHTANPNSVSGGQQSTLTADFLKNSDASSNVASDLNALIGLPITFNNAVLGTLSSAQTTIQSNGAATAIFTAGSTSGTGSANATVDSQTVTANITITVPGTTVTSINRDGSSPTNAASVSWTVVFADALSGLTTSNFTVVNGGLGGSPGIGTVSPVGSAPATSWTVTASTGSGSGTLGLDLTNDTGLDHALTNLPFTGQVYTIDNAAPTVTMSSAAPNPTNTSPISVTAQFSENVTGFEAGDITAGNATVGNFVAVDGDTYTFDLTPAGDGTVTADIAANAAQDSLGNGNLAATQFSRTYDTTVPTVTMTSATSNPTNVSPIPVTVQFSENVTAFTASDIVTSGDFDPTINNFVAVDGDTYTFDLVPFDPGGGCVESWFVAADIAADVAQDGAGNGNTAAVQFSRTFDDNPPCVSINQADGQADPTSNSPIHFKVGFSQPVSGFGDDSGDVTLSGTAGATTAVVTEIDGSTYDVAVSGMTTDGTVIASIPANVASDAAGNGNDVSNSDDNTVTFIADSTPPDTTITANPTNPTNSTSASFSFTGSDNQTLPASLTFECKLDAGAFGACTSPKSYSGLALGSHTFAVRAIDAAGNVDPTPASFTWEIHAATSLLYNGAQIVNVGESFQPAAKLSSAASACISGKTISFTLDRNPLTGAAGPYSLGTATTNSSGQATMGSVNTAGWQEGIYELYASFAGTSNCDPSSDQATLTVASPGNSANGGGWYTLSGSGRVNFGFTVRKTDNKCTSNCTYKGQVLLINNGKWRLKGTLSTYSKLSTGQGAASGTGDLYWWDSSLNGGLGDWALAQSGVSFTINFYDSGKKGKASTDTFGINIQYKPVSPQPNTLPNSAPQVLKGGDIKVQ